MSYCAYVFSLIHLWRHPCAFCKSSNIERLQYLFSLVELRRYTESEISRKTMQILKTFFEVFLLRRSTGSLWKIMFFFFFYKHKATVRKSCIINSLVSFEILVTKQRLIQFHIRCSCKNWQFISFIHN